SREIYIISDQNQSLISLSLEEIPESQKKIEIDTRLGNFDFWAEGIRQEWCLRCGSKTWIEVATADRVYQYKSIKLPKSGKFDVCEENGKRLTLYVYPGNTSHIPSTHYSIEGFSTIQVGRSDSCEIQVLNPLVSRKHFILEQYGKKLKIFDQKSGVGTLLNKEKTSSAVLEAGDCIEIPGLTICIGIGFISIKANPHLYKVKHLPKIIASEELYTSKRPEALEPISPFVRRPRIRSFHCAIKKIEVEAPPMPIIGDKIPLSLRMGGSAIYSGMSALSGNFTSMISSVLFPLLTSKYTDKQKVEYEERRARRYMAYLNQKYNEINQAIHDQKRELEENNPSPTELNKMISS
ncbi:MAG: FHA domain-containing protein, partial [Allobaculum sp.]|nr:FHA domain-containing protein [Allobaculum sp.]